MRDVVVLGSTGSIGTQALEVVRAHGAFLIEDDWAHDFGITTTPVPLAAGVLAPIGFVLPMSVGAILMSASTVVVALNAQLLRRLDLSPAASTTKLAGHSTTS